MRAHVDLMSLMKEVKRRYGTTIESSSIEFTNCNKHNGYTVGQTQRYLCQNLFQRNNQRFTNSNPLNFENQFRPQQQNPCYPNEQARYDPNPRNKQYNQEVYQICRLLIIPL